MKWRIESLVPLEGVYVVKYNGISSAWEMSEFELYFIVCMAYELSG